jgi:hypothetical protein
MYGNCQCCLLVVGAHVVFVFELETFEISECCVCCDLCLDRITPVAVDL